MHDRRHRALCSLSALPLALGLVACGPSEGDPPPAATGEKPPAAPPTAPDAAAPPRAEQVVAGREAACARLQDGTVRCWGRNDYGEMGSGKKSPTDQTVPTVVPGLRNVKALSMGGDPGDQGDAVCALHDDGAVTCWGYPRLIPGATAPGPTRVESLAGVTQIAFGGGTGYAITGEGTVLGWGSPLAGALGDGASSGNDRPPAPIPAVVDVTALAAGKSHACALGKTGTVTCWGYEGTRLAPVEIEGLSGVTGIAAARVGDQTCATTEAGTVSCWGADRSPKALEGLREIVELSADAHWCARAKSGGVQCWGSDAHGELATGGPLPGDSTKTPAETQLAGVAQLDLGDRTGCAVTEAGEVQCWGDNRRGQLGDGTLIDRSAPVSVPGVLVSPESLTNPATPELAPSPVAMRWDDLPKPCARPERLKVGDDGGGALEVVSAFAQRADDGLAITVTVADYPLDPKRVGPPRSTQRQAGVRFTKARKTPWALEPQEVTTGDYSLSWKDVRRAFPFVRNKVALRSVTASNPDEETPGSVEISHLDETWVCGTFAVTGDVPVSIEGPFAARFVETMKASN